MMLDITIATTKTPPMTRKVWPLSICL
ncbi:hypothetical protein E2C01_053960 [Portunus trituberculatus]|uniref:Uncharacterized protein n=1 Tax=Portunus trituberculatus TaxID=210409 RepID=A0A5B7GS91_PORTR|nr:hypothetical protein [Portunus trituberculatus]